MSENKNLIKKSEEETSNPLAYDISDKKDYQCFDWFLTFNAKDGELYTHERFFKELKVGVKNCLYGCIADEKGSCLHSHALACFSSKVRFSTIKKKFPTAHIEAVRCKRSEVIDYINKEGKWKDTAKRETVIEGTFEERGYRPPDTAGKRTDLSILYDLIKDGYTNSQILAINQDYTQVFDRFDKIRTAIKTDEYRNKLRTDIECIYIFGPTGVGKTRLVHEENNISDVFRITDYFHPYDGYNYEPVLFYDEFYSSIKMSDMLVALDIYPLELPARYVNRIACFTKVYIASNISLEQQYTDEQANFPEKWKAFLRRISKVIMFTGFGEYIVFDSVDDYFNRDKSC